MESAIIQEQQHDAEQECDAHDHKQHGVEERFGVFDGYRNGVVARHLGGTVDGPHEAREGEDGQAPWLDLRRFEEAADCFRCIAGGDKAAPPYGRGGQKAVVACVHHDEDAISGQLVIRVFGQSGRRRDYEGVHVVHSCIDGRNGLVDLGHFDGVDARVMEVRVRLHPWDIHLILGDHVRARVVSGKVLQIGGVVVVNGAPGEVGSYNQVHVGHAFGVAHVDDFALLFVGGEGF